MPFEYREFEPPSSLDLLVRRSFVAKGRIPYRSDTILPTGLIPVLFNAGRPHRVGKSPNPADNLSFAHSWIDGFQTTPTYNTPTDGTHVLGLLFEPIGFHALFQADMLGIRDRTIDGREVLPDTVIAAVKPMLPRSDGASTHEELFSLLSHLPRTPLPEWLWSIYRDIRNRRGGVTLAACYGRHGVSARQATAAFKAAIGVTPKRLCRIHRLLALLEAVDPSRPVTWTELAHRYDFYDQAHFNHEFRRLAGLYPSEYLAQRRRDLPELGRGESVMFVPTR